jgi:hypothetical protein
MIYRRDLLVGALAAASASSISSTAARSASPTTQSPFACDRLALTPALRHRHFDELGPFLRTKIVAVRAETDGYTFRFPNDWNMFASLTEWVNGERYCCPFFDFDLRLAREHGELWMKLSGRPGTADFIRSDFAPWFAAASARK